MTYPRSASLEGRRSVESDAHLGMADGLVEGVALGAALRIRGVMHGQTNARRDPSGELSKQLYLGAPVGDFEGCVVGPTLIECKHTPA